MHTCNSSIIYHSGLATHKKGHGTRLQKYWPIRHELAMIDGMAVKVNNRTISVADADIKPATQHPYGNQEDKVACAQIHILLKYAC